MPLDQVLVGSVVTGIMALLSQAVSKCKCRFVCARDDDGFCQPSSCACGFLDAPLFETVANDKASDDEGEPP